MGKGALITRKNSGHNVLALKEQGGKDLVALATLYYTTQVAGQADATEEANRTHETAVVIRQSNYLKNVVEQD